MVASVRSPTTPARGSSVRCSIQKDGVVERAGLFARSALCREGNHPFPDATENRATRRRAIRFPGGTP